MVSNEHSMVCVKGPVGDHGYLYPLQRSDTPLHLAASRGHTTCVECLLSTPGIAVNIKDMVSWSYEEKNGQAIP